MEGQISIVKLIENINQELYDIASEQNSLVESFLEENPPLTFTSCGYAHSITFFDIVIWCSENDDRPYINENTPEEDHIPLEMWIKQEVKRILSLMYDFHLCLEGKLM